MKSRDLKKLRLQTFDKRRKFMNKVRKIWIAVLTAIAVMCASIVALTFVRGGGQLFSK